MSRHEELFKQIVTDNCFAWACARYAEKGDDPIAKAQLERLRKAAVAAIFVHRTALQETNQRPYRNSLIVLVCLLLAMFVALFVTKYIHDNRGPDITKPTPR